MIDILIRFFQKNPGNDRKSFLREKKSELKKLVKIKNYDKALGIGEKILEKNPDDLDVLFILGGIHFMRKKYLKSISYFDKVLDVSSYDPEALLLKANALFELGQNEDALAHCNKIKEIDPKNKGVNDLLKKISGNKQ